MDFCSFFKQATGKEPFHYQKKLAEDPSWSDILRAPTGTGKTAAIILGWLWRRLWAPEPIRQTAPTRLVYCLPMRVLVDQTFSEAQRWLTALEISDRVGLQMLMGGEDATNWFLNPERETVIIGTQDMLLSRALNRGYGMSRYRWPVEFGLLNNDCLWVLDEVQLMGSGLATTTQLDAFRESFGTIGNSKTIWMSATLRKNWFETIDFKEQARSLTAASIGDDDRKSEVLTSRLQAKKTLKLCPENISDMSGLAKSIVDAHQSGTLTLVVLNTVDRAIEVYKLVRDKLLSPKKTKGKQLIPADAINETTSPLLVLLHSRFRPLERKQKLQEVLKRTMPQEGLIVVTTQVIEAGVDISAKTLFTELAPLSSLIQRFGRCNRFGEYKEASVYWVDILDVSKSENDKDGKKIREKRIKNALPYDLDAIEAATEILVRPKFDDVGPDSLDNLLTEINRPILNRLFPYDPVHVIRKKDFVELFDTTPDIAGNDIDVSRFIRDGEELDVQVFWRDIVGSLPSPEEKPPGKDELCSVPVYSFRKFIEKESGKLAYRWDSLAAEWLRVSASNVFPGQIYLVPSDQGGYDTETGWNPSIKKVGPIKLDDVVTNDQDDYSRDRLSDKRSWEKIKEHTEKVVQQLIGMMNILKIELNSETKGSLIEAARWHDRGKAHHIFIEAIIRDENHQGDDWAKAPEIKRYQRKGFRHELAGALAMLQAERTDLACYLAAAHHGKVRLSIRSLPTETRPADPGVRFARGIWDGEKLPSTDLGGGVIAPDVELSLEPMELGLSPDGKSSWVERMLNLRDDPNLGPLKLAFLEALLRVADMRASAGALYKGQNQEEEIA